MQPFEAQSPTAPVHIERHAKRHCTASIADWFLARTVAVIAKVGRLRKRCLIVPQPLADPPSSSAQMSKWKSGEASRIVVLYHIGRWLLRFSLAWDSVASTVVNGAQMLPLNSGSREETSRAIRRF